MIRYLWAALLLLASVTAASAQGSAVNLQCLTGSSPPWANCSSTFPLPVTVTSGGGGGSVTQGTVPWVVSGQGTAGTAATGVLTMQGIASMTPILSTLSAETTKVIGTVNQGTSPWVISGAVTNAGTFAVQAATQSAVNITLADCSGTITSGGTAQNAFIAAATRHGFTIANIDTSEVLWFSMTTTAAASGTGSYPLAPATATTFAGLASFTSPVGLGINTALSVIAATTAHKFSCTVW